MKDRKVLVITSIGKRVQLIKHLRKYFKIIGLDAGESNASMYFVDKFYKIQKAVEKDYIIEVLKICKTENADAIIPLYEGEFSILNTFRCEFEKLNTKLILSSGKIIDVCKNKYDTFKYFSEENICTPYTYSESEISNIIELKDESRFPMFIKPADGMGSSNTFKINNINELVFFKEYVKNGIIQECIIGDEYTVDVLVDFYGRPVYIIPRSRIEVRSGEVVKSKTIGDEKIIKETLKVIESLNKLKDEYENSTCGPLTIQFFKTDKNKLYLLEINPRFGGGVPLSFEAGADYGNALYNMLNNEKIIFENKFDEKTMLRYDEAVYIDQ